MFTENGSVLVSNIEVQQQFQLARYAIGHAGPIIVSDDEAVIVQMYKPLSLRERIPNWTLIKVLSIAVGALQKYTDELTREGFKN